MAPARGLEGTAMLPRQSPDTQIGDSAVESTAQPVDAWGRSLQRYAKELSDVVCWRHESVF